MNIHVEMITEDDAIRLLEFDALFIRTTTSLIIIHSICHSWLHKTEWLLLTIRCLSFGVRTKCI